MSLNIIILTGQAGSGKSTAMRALEDEHFLCVDNMPASLSEQLVALVRHSGKTEHLALVMDVREVDWLQQVPDLVKRLRTAGEIVRLVYLESQDDALVRRYSETRRRHPLDDGCGLKRAIVSERELLAPLRELADDTLDTSRLSPHDLRSKILCQLAGVTMGDDLRVALVSFGYKHGLPLDADMVLDVRFLPNPYFEASLRLRSGLDEPVCAYVLGSEAGKMYIEKARSFMEFLLPRFKREGKRYLTLAVGCTGGQHRSVAVAAALGERLAGQGLSVDVRHRDVRDLSQ